jgi:hypothetical protein
MCPLAQQLIYRWSLLILFWANGAPLKRRRCRVIAWNYLWGWTMEADG